MPLNRVLLLAALAVVALTARLGWWQLDRAAQKITLQQAQEARAGLPPLAADDLPRDAAGAAAVLHRRARLQGRWLDRHSVLLDNRPMAGRTGFYLVTPLQLDDGSVVLVQRGWLPRDRRDRARVAVPAPTAAPVAVEGRIEAALPRLYEFDAAASGAIRQNLNLDAYARETGLALRPWALIQHSGPASDADGLLRNWPAPNLGVHKHYGYAFQWFALSLLTAALYVWFQFIRPRRRPHAQDPA